MNLLHASPVALLLAQIAVIMAASRAFALVFRRLGQPLVVAEICAGIALGPSLLGQLSPGAMATLFPTTGMGALSAVAQLGLVLFMFVVGLEFDPALVRQRGSLAVAVSQYSIVVPLLLGVMLALGLYPVFATSDVKFEGFALFMGASMSVTAFPVLARILAERGLLRTQIGALTLTCAAVNDVTAWCLLALTIAVVNAGGIVEGLGTTALAGAFIAIMLGVVRPFLERVARRYGTLEGLSQTAIAAILFGLLISAFLAEAIGIHALFGAFLFGAVVPRREAVIRALTERLEDLVVVLLLPLFFAFTGLRTEIGLVDSRELWAYCVVIVLAASVGKIAGAAIPARLGGLSRRDSAVLGVLMNTRGLMELVILNIGRDLGVLSPVLFTILVIMAVVTTLVTSPVVAWLYPRSQALADTVAPPSSPGATVLACASHPGTAGGLARLTAALCQTPDVRGLALHLTPEEGMFPDGETPAPEEEDAAEVLAREASSLGARVEPLRLPSTDTASDIVAVAERKRADLVLMGLHRPLVGTAQLGGPVREVAARLRCDLGMFLDHDFSAARKVLVARGGPHDRAAARISAWLKRVPGVAVAELADPGGDREEALIRAAEGYDLVVVGVGAAWGLAMHGFDVREHALLSRLPCSLLAVHGPDGA
ncbi:MAG: cation:proton antiporter [Myxococcota bacterium]